MYEEEYVEQQPNREQIKQVKNQRNAANNAQLINTAADVAMKTGNPVAMGIGGAVKGVDKLTGGRASMAAGKLMNKFNPKGAQMVANTLAKPLGLASRIGSALGKKGGTIPKKGGNVQGNATAPGKSNDGLSRREVEDQTSDGGSSSVKMSAKAIKIGIAVMPAVLVLLVFMNLMVAGSQIYLKVIGLGQADEASNAEVETAIRENGANNLDEEITDENLTGYIYDEDLFIENFSVNKLNRLNFIANETSSKYNEAELNELEDYYHDINNYKSGDYNMDDVYRFYFKLYYIQKRYERDYYVSLDIPLLMATLYIESEDMSQIFISNTKGYKVYNDTDKNINYEYFSYNHDWSSHKLSKIDSSYDIEILAQNMVSRIENSNCPGTVDGACYKIDQDKYREFLKGFLEKKYFINEGAEVGESPETNNNDNNNSNSPAMGNFRTWTQCKQKWSSKIVPTSSQNMCSIGCLITSVSIQIARSGTITLESPFDPGVALEKFKFVNGGNFVWASTTNIAPNFKYRSSINVAGMSKEKIIEKISSYDSNKYYFILAVSKKDRNSVHHYVALDYVDAVSNKIYIMDPASTSKTDLYEHYKLYSMAIYEKKD